MPFIVPRSLRNRCCVPTVLSLLLSLLVVPAVLAEPPAAAAKAATPAASTTAATSNLNAAEIQARLTAAEGNASLADDAKAALVEQYKAALASLDQLAANNKAAAAFRAAIDQAPGQAALIRKRLAAAKPLPDPPVELPKGAALAEVERLLGSEGAEVSALEARLAATRQALDDEAAQLPTLRKRLAEVRQAAQDLEGQLVQPAGGAGDLAAATTQANEARRDALRAEALMLDQQMLSADARKAFGEARRDEAEFDLGRAQARRAWLQGEVERRRRDEAEKVRSETEAAAAATADADPLVQGLAKDNATLAERIDQLNHQVEQAEARRLRAEQITAQVETDFRNARQRLEVAGLNQALGQVLLDQRGRLPDPRTLNREADQRADAIAEATLNGVRYDEEQRELARGAALVYADALAALPETERPKLLRQLSEQVARRQDLLRRAEEGEGRLLRALADLDFAAGQLTDQVAGYNAFLAEHLLWVRSDAPITQQSFVALPAALAWVVDPGNWLKVGKVLGYEATHALVPWIWLVVVIALLLRRSNLLRRLRATAEPLRRISTERFSYTLVGLGLTVLVALPWPLLMTLTGTVLGQSVQADEFTKAVGHALQRVSHALFYLLVFRALFMSGGVADRHFRWSAETLRRLRLDLDLAVYLLLPLGFLAAMMFQHTDPVFAATLGRLALVAFSLGFAVVLSRILHPTRGIMSGLLASHPEGWANRSRWVWYGLTIAVPLGLAGLALMGFQYTAGTIVNLLIDQLWFVLGLVVVQQSVIRWLMVTRRSLSLKAALERRAARDAARDASEGGAAPALDTLMTVEQEAVDLAALDSQTRQLVNGMLTFAALAGLWLLWSELLPALNVFERFTLWSYSSEVDGVAQMVPVTLADLGLILLIVIIATAAVRNLPALIEILLLKNTEVSAGGRYTITTLTGYAITAIATLLVFSALGLNWSQVQWLVAALSVGIGFGLQEIVANFISGLIILFERPVRVGDIITVGQTTGVVTKIEIRATTIRNWDRQELLVPNKEFITGQLLNWSLTDQINRVTINVGVDYGTDTRRAAMVLAEVAAGHPRVLEEPAPVITFEGFGDNTLSLVLRCYLESLDGRMDITTELHHRILERFVAEGIEIAFPQRDVHLNSRTPLEVVWRAADQPAAGGGANAPCRI